MNRISLTDAVRGCHLDGEATNCPSCGSMELLFMDFIKVSRQRRKTGQLLAFVTGCKSCGLVFVNPPPTEEELAAYYGEDGGWNDKIASRVNRPASPYRQTIRKMFVAEAERLRNEEGLTKVFDIGCGDGAILDDLQDTGWSTAGLDPATAHTITRHPILPDIPGEPGYDLVILKHVVEHVADPLALLKRAHGCLVPGGYMLIGCPTLDNLTEHGKKRYCINSNHHIAAFTRRTLTNLLALAGFSVERFLPHPLIHRMALLARADASAKPVAAPLRGLQDAFRRHAVQEGEGWWRARLPTRTRALLALREEEAAIEKKKAKKAERAGVEKAAKA